MLSLEAQGEPFKSLVDFIHALLAPTQNEQRQVSAAVRAGWAENFAGERSGDGQSWAALRPFTVREREARGYPGAHPILVQSGHMRNSLLNAGAPDSYEDLQANGGGWTLTVGTTDSKALKHEQGEGRIPARPFIALSSQAEQRVEDSIAALVAQIEARILGQ